MGEFLWRLRTGTVLSGKEFFLRFAVKISGPLCLGA